MALIATARFALAKRLQRWANGVASLLQSGGRPTANDKTAATQRERTAKAALTLIDTVFLIAFVRNEIGRAHV